MQTPIESRSVGELFAELAHETTTLVRKELELARAELSQGAARMARGMVSVAVGALLALLGLQALLACAILVLTRWVDAWLAALIVGVVVLAIGAVLMLVGRRRLDVTALTPRRTIATLKDDRGWVKEQVR